MHPATNPQRYTSEYIWIIDKDHQADPSYTPPSNMNAVGMMGGSGADEELLKLEKFETFRMLDDDGEVYYEGRIFGDYQGFEPLDDFGTPNAGCCDIQYKGDKWESI